MKLIRIIDENGTEQTFLAHLVIKFEKLEENVTGLLLEFPLHEMDYKAYMNDDKLIDKIYGNEDDLDDEYEIIDCKPPEDNSTPQVVANRPPDGDEPSFGDQMDMAMKARKGKDIIDEEE